MALRCAPPEFDSIEILEHILDKGMMVDAWLRIGLVGLELSRLESRFVVAAENPDHGPARHSRIRASRSAGKNNLLHMCLGPTPPEKNSLDVLDRVLDKGIVMEAWLRTELAGVSLHGRRCTSSSAQTEIVAPIPRGVRPGLLP